MGLSREQIKDHLETYLDSYSFEELKEQMIEYGATPEDIQSVYNELKSNSNNETAPLPPPELTKNNSEDKSKSNEDIIAVKKEIPNEDKDSRFKPIPNEGGTDSQIPQGSNALERIVEGGIIGSILSKLNYLLILIVTLAIGFGIFAVINPDQVAYMLIDESGDFSGYFEMDEFSYFDKDSKTVYLRLTYLPAQSLGLNPTDSKNLISLPNSHQCFLRSATSNSVNFEEASTQALNQGDVIDLEYSCSRIETTSDLLNARVHFNLYDYEADSFLPVNNNAVFIKN